MFGRMGFGVFLILSACTVVAAPAPFGMELNSDCESQLRTRTAAPTGINKYSVGPMYDIDTSGIDFRDLRNLTIICDSDDKLVGVLASLSKRSRGATFKRLVGMLEGKYQTVSVEGAYVGTRKAQFYSDGVVIRINEPHLGFTTKLEYLTQNFLERFNASDRRERQRQRQSESNAL